MAAVDASRIATHAEPVWRDRADFMVHADLAQSGLPGRWGQLWTQRLGDRTFRLCCIPFFTYGMSLGDVVNTVSTSEFEHALTAVTQPSSHRTLRLAVCEPQNEQLVSDLHHLVHGVLQSLDLPHEWHARGYVAVDLAEVGQEGAVLRILEPYFEQGRLTWEIA